MKDGIYDPYLLLNKLSALIAHCSLISFLLTVMRPVLNDVYTYSSNFTINHINVRYFDNTTLKGTLVLSIFFIIKDESRTYQSKHREPSVKTHTVPIKVLPFLTFRRILEALCVVWRNSTTSFALLPEQRNEYIKYYMSLSGNRTTNRRAHSSTLVSLRRD